MHPTVCCDTGGVITRRAGNRGPVTKGRDRNTPRRSASIIGALDGNSLQVPSPLSSDLVAPLAFTLPLRRVFFPYLGAGGGDFLGVCLDAGLPPYTSAKVSFKNDDVALSSSTLPTGRTIRNLHSRTYPYVRRAPLLTYPTIPPALCLPPSSPTQTPKS